MTVVMRDRSVAGKAGWFSTGIQIVSNAGKAYVTFSDSSWARAAPGSNWPAWTIVAWALRLANSTSKPPTWKNGSGVQKRSLSPRPIRSASDAPCRTTDSWVCTQPRGFAVVPEV